MCTQEDAQPSQPFSAGLLINQQAYFGDEICLMKFSIKRVLTQERNQEGFGDVLKYSPKRKNGMDKIAVAQKEVRLSCK